MLVFYLALYPQVKKKLLKLATIWMPKIASGQEARSAGKVIAQVLYIQATKGDGLCLVFFVCFFKLQCVRVHNVHRI